MMLLQQIVALLLILVCFELGVESVSFQLPSNYRKCLREEVRKNVLVTGDYELSPAPADVKTDLYVVDARAQKLYGKENVDHGKFAFTTEDYELFDVCFESRYHGAPGTNAPRPRSVSLVLKHGVEAKSYEDAAKVEKLKPLELDLRKLEDLSEDIMSDFAWMRKREEEMRSTNESTHSKVLYFSVFFNALLTRLSFVASAVSTKVF